MKRWLGLLLLCAPAVYASGPLSSATASGLSPAASFLAQADAAYAKRADLPAAKIALEYYQRAYAADPTSAEAYWKAARVAWWLGDHAEKRSEKMAYFQKGIDQGHAAVERTPNSVEAHFWLAANLGAFGEAKGIFKSLSMVKPIRQEMAEVLRLDDHYLGGGGYRVLGVVDYKVPGIVGGNKKRALEELNKALAIAPNEPFTHYYLAEYYKIMGDKAKSQEHLKILQELKVPADSQPELEMLQAKAKKNF